MNIYYIKTKGAGLYIADVHLLDFTTDPSNFWVTTSLVKAKERIQEAKKEYPDMKYMILEEWFDHEQNLHDS